MGSLVVRASGSRLEGLGSMPDATKYTPSRHGIHAQIVEVEIGGVTLYRLFEEFRRANSYCHLNGAQDQAYIWPLATMNFVGLDLTKSDSRANQNNAHCSLVESRLTGCGWHCSIYKPGGNVIGRETSEEIHYFLKESRGSQNRQHAHQMSPKSPNWRPTWLLNLIPTGLYRQDFAKFSESPLRRKERCLLVNSTILK
ncbi:hypothetical protein TNCV_1373171 [Trichonephila clavipes]|uniref:Uncharacterized protein n=1 Tax=Trichonephila clavipes TaxID=2585209 RepID=A0A8X6WI99_TRICX|nr:hypothetical protein TNCV_1373171 [Trichonephila clavipes]